MQTRLFLAASLALSVSFISCKKDKETTTNDTNIATHSDDQSRVSSATDDVADDANSVIDNFGAFNGRTDNTANLLLPCNADVVLDSTASLRRLTVNYHGANCIGNRIRQGTVVLTMPLGQHWGDQHAVLNVETQNLHITRVADGKSITISGTSTITNETGGRLYELATLGTIEHVIASPGITVTFDDGTQRNWQVAKRRTFTYNSGIVVTTNGNHTEGGNSHISEWGTNRFGDSFTASISSPMIIRQDCNFRLTGGQITHEGALGTLVATFGLDANGDATGCPGSAPYYYKAVWTGIGGVVRTIIYPY